MWRGSRITQHGSDLEGKEKDGSMSAWEWGLGEIVHVNPARMYGMNLRKGWELGGKLDWLTLLLLLLLSRFSRVRLCATP